MSPHWPHGAALWMIGTFTVVVVVVGSVVNWWQNRPIPADDEDLAWEAMKEDDDPEAATR